MFPNQFIFCLEKIIHIINIIHTPVGRTEPIYKTFSFYGVHIWNHISRTVQPDVFYTSFKCIVTSENLHSKQ